MTSTATNPGPAIVGDVDIWHPDMPVEYRNQIVTGDSRELAKRIPDESIDLVFCDPVYQNIDDYRWLAETAARVLKPDSAALVWFDEPNFNRAYKALTECLTFAAMMHWQRHGHLAPGRSGITVITPCLWLEKGHSKTHQKIANWFSTSNNGADSFTHDWGKPEALVSKWLAAFADTTAIVYDPFTGGGTVPAVCKMLGRNYVASEIDPDVAERARQRVLETQAWFIVPQPEQLKLLG